MKDLEKLVTLADACSDALLGGESGWREMDFAEFVIECRKAISKKNKLKLRAQIMIDSNYIKPSIIAFENEMKET